MPPTLFCLNLWSTWSVFCRRLTKCMSLSSIWFSGGGGRTFPRSIFSTFPLGLTLGWSTGSSTTSTIEAIWLTCLANCSYLVLFYSNKGVINVTIWWVNMLTNSWWLSSRCCWKVANDLLVYKGVVSDINLGMFGYIGPIVVFPAFYSGPTTGPDSDPK